MVFCYKDTVRETKGYRYFRFFSYECVVGMFGRAFTVKALLDTDFPQIFQQNYDAVVQAAGIDQYPPFVLLRFSSVRYSGAFDCRSAERNHRTGRLQLADVSWHKSDRCTFRRHQPAEGACWSLVQRLLASYMIPYSVVTGLQWENLSFLNQNNIEIKLIGLTSRYYPRTKKNEILKASKTRSDTRVGKIQKFLKIPPANNSYQTALLDLA